MHPSCSTLSSSASISKFISDIPCLSMLEKSCTTMKDLQKLHAQIIKTGLAKDTIAASRVLSFCATSPGGNIDYAYLVFSQIKQQNLFTWNTIIRGFSQSSKPQHSILLFIDMLNVSPIEPQELTYPSVFKAYSQLGLAKDGSQLHGRIIKLGLESDPFIRNTLIFMYANCGYLVEATRLFDENSNFDVVAWNSMIMGLAKNGQIDESRRLFSRMPTKNTVSWNTMIGGLAKNGRLNEAFDLFRRMQNEGVKPSEFTTVILLNACSLLGALKQGEWIHAYIKKNNIEVNTIVLTAIIGMYCKCGSIKEALHEFENASNKGLASWNSMILGLAMNGCGKEAIRLFSKLRLSGLEPNDVSFIGVLTACNHSGMVNEAKEYFLLMTDEYKIEPTIKHFGCLVDVLSRAGFLDEAEELINRMAVQPNAIIWGSLLSGCRKHKNIELGKRAAEKMIELDPSDSGSYILLSNICAHSGRFEEAIDIRFSMKERRVRKEPGCSLVEVNGEVHEFVAGGDLHPQAAEIYALLDEFGLMLKEEGYVYDNEFRM